MTLIIDNGSWGCKSGLSTQDKPFILFSAALDETDSFTGQGDAERLEKALKCTFKCLNDASIGLKVNQEFSSIFNAFSKLDLPNFPFFQAQLSQDCAGESLSEKSIDTVIVVNEMTEKTKICELLFEKFGLQRVAVSDQKPLQLLNSGRTSGVSVNLGYKNASAAALLNGFCFSEEFHAVLPGISGECQEKIIMELLQREQVVMQGTSEHRFLLDFAKHFTLNAPGGQSNQLQLPDGQILEVPAETRGVMAKTLKFGVEHLASFLDAARAGPGLETPEITSSVLISGGVSYGSLKKAVEDPLKNYTLIQTPEPLFDAFQGAQIAASLAPSNWFINKAEYLDKGLERL